MNDGGIAKRRYHCMAQSQTNVKLSKWDKGNSRNHTSCQVFGTRSKWIASANQMWRMVTGLYIGSAISSRSDWTAAYDNWGYKHELYAWSHHAYQDIVRLGEIRNPPVDGLWHIPTSPSLCVVVNLHSKGNCSLYTIEHEKHKRNVSHWIKYRRRGLLFALVPLTTIHGSGMA